MSQKIMTSTQYVANNGKLCPLCESTDLLVGNYDQDTMSQHIECNDCHATWYENYQLANYSSLTGSFFQEIEIPEDITVNQDDVVEAANDLIKAAKLVIERWEDGNLAEAVRNLDVVIGWAETTLKGLPNESDKEVTGEH